MCLILFAYRNHPRYELVIAANRDEFYERPTATMEFWEDAPELLAGRDLEAGGTWLGVTRGGRFAAITNYRDPSQVRSDAPSRGALVSDFLRSDESAWDYLGRLERRAETYNGFNLIVWDSKECCYYSNRDGKPRILPPGLYGLSNHLLNTPWPKVERGRQKLAALLDTENGLELGALLELLQDRAQAPDTALPDTGISIEWERVLSPMFIESAAYGTRSSTAIIAAKEGVMKLAEKSWPTGTRREFWLG